MKLFTKNVFNLFIGWRCTQNSFLLKRGARPSYCFWYCCAFVICAWFFQCLFDCTWFPPGVCVHQLFWTIGGMFEVLLALWIMPTLGWRWLLGLSATPIAVCIICSYVSVLVIYKINWRDQSVNKLARSKRQLKSLCCAVAARKSPLWHNDGKHSKGCGNFKKHCQRKWQEHAWRKDYRPETGEQNETYI